MTGLLQGIMEPPSATGPRAVPEGLGFPVWAGLWQTLGVVPPPRPTYETLLRRYSEPHRAYHTLQHLAECLGVRRRVDAECESPSEVDLALWFHDAVHQPLRSDNESRSAQWLDDVARDSGLAEGVRLRLRGLVLATRHEAAPASADEAVLVDTDLSILGAPPDRFEEYDRQVRREYRHIPGLVYRRKRRQVLEGFLARERIFHTDAYFGVFEQQARLNLVRAITRYA